MPELRPPGALADPAARGRGNQGWFWLALVVVLILGLAVVLVLPRLVAGPAPAPAGTAAQVPPVSGTADAAPERSKAEQTLQAYLKLRAKLELANAMQWGEAEMNNAAYQTTEGDRMFGQRQFTAAAERYAAALQGLELLESESGTRLAGALESGALALAANETEGAIQYFETALAIEPENEPAQTGLARAQVRTRLLQLMAAAQQAERAADFSAAQTALRSAVQLDAAYAPAADALLRLTRVITERDFQDAMSRALVELDEGNLTAAGTALAEAARLKPNEAIVGDTQQQLQLAHQQQRLTQLRRQASDKSRSENWSAAAGLYRDVLVIAPNAGFARDGLARAQDRMRLHQQLDYYLDNPTRIYSAQPLANAEQLLKSAGVPPAAETRLTGKVKRLRKLVATARTPLPVTLVSDGLTNVVIYYVGRLGKFTSRQLELRPGTYTVVGSRDGYRDVRRTLTVRPGQDQPTLDIRSEEAV